MHLSAAEALPEIAAARAEGVRLSVETCPHYLTLAAESVPDGQTQFKCCPPVRGAANADLLWRALQDGVIDCVVSDHSPCTPDLKGLEAGDFDAAWGGISSLQLGLPLVWTEARRRGIDLATVVGWMSAAPARVVGLGRRGHVEVGAPADLVVFAPDETLDRPGGRAAAPQRDHPVRGPRGHRPRAPDLPRRGRRRPRRPAPRPAAVPCGLSPGPRH